MPENKRGHCQFLERWAVDLCLELDCNHHHIILVEELVVKAIHVAGMRNNTVTTSMLDGTKFLHSIVKIAHICRRSPYVGVLDCERIHEHVHGYLRSI